MSGIDPAATIVIFTITLLVVGVGEFIMHEAKKSNLKIGIPIEGFARNTLVFQTALHATAVLMVGMLIIFF